MSDDGTTTTTALDRPRSQETTMVRAKAEALARADRAAAERIVRGRIWGKETLTEAEASVLIEMHRFYGLDPSQDHIVPMGGKAYFTADAYRYRALAHEDFGGLDFVRLDSLREALAHMDLDTRSVYVRQLSEVSLGLVTEAFADRDPDEIAYACIVKRIAPTGYHYSVGIGRATPRDAVSAEKVAEHAQTRAVRRALRDAYRIDFPGVDEASIIRLDDFQAQRRPAAAALPSGPTMPYGNSRGKRPEELADDDLAWYLGAFEKSVADPSKAKYRNQNAALRDAVAAEIARRAASSSEAKRAAEPRSGGPRRGAGTKQTAQQPASEKTEPSRAVSETPASAGTSDTDQADPGPDGPDPIGALFD